MTTWKGSMAVGDRRLCRMLYWPSVFCHTVQCDVRLWFSTEFPVFREISVTIVLLVSELVKLKMPNLLYRKNDLVLISV